MADPTAILRSSRDRLLHLRGSPETEIHGVLDAVNSQTVLIAGTDAGEGSAWPRRRTALNVQVDEDRVSDDVE